MKKFRGPTKKQIAFDANYNGPCYGGVLNQEKMNKIERKGYASWKAQREHCNNKNNPGYRYYGKKGIKVEYSSRQFIGWWTAEYKKNPLKKPTVGRLDHEKNYTFKNIKLEEHLENSTEGAQRRARKLKEHSYKSLADKVKGLP